MNYKTKEPGGARSSIWLSEPLRAWIEAEAERNNTSSAEVIRAAIRELKAKVERKLSAPSHPSQKGGAQ